MISLNEVVRSLYGAYRLARLDALGLDFFNPTVAGFWRSFFAAVLVSPLYIVLVLIRYGDLWERVPLFRFLAIETIAYVIAWVAFPVIMATVTKSIDRERHFIRFIVAYNWAGVLQNALYLPIVIFGSAGLLAATGANTLALLAISLIIVYTWFITRTALDVTGAQAAGIVGLDFLISIFINAVANGMI